jgi:hypothetical protein
MSIPCEFIYPTVVSKTFWRLWVGLRYSKGTFYSCNNKTFKTRQYMSYVYSGWLRGVNKDVKLLLLLGGAVTCWSIWLSRNDIVLEKYVSPMQVIYLVTHWLRTWAILQKPDLKDIVLVVSQHLTQVAAK